MKGPQPVGEGVPGIGVPPIHVEEFVPDRGHLIWQNYSHFHTGCIFSVPVFHMSHSGARLSQP